MPEKVIPFPGSTRTPKAVSDFKRVCDDMGLELRDDEEAKQAIATIKAALEIEEPAPVPPRDDV